MKYLFDSMYFLLDKRMTRAPVASREQIQSAMQTMKGDAADRLRELTLQQQMHQRNQLMQQQGINLVTLQTFSSKHSSVENLHN